ncbi:MAG: exodeoxyribonuclease VII large subunit [Candidatus Omnitrophica bacterium]|nr:exodeoxyribonuclease VII large subunit [Candidatus Omnitrophota bacterium]
MPGHPGKKIYTVSEVTRQVRLLLEDAFPFFWVAGEASNVRRPASGHLYFTLKDEGAQLSCVMFRGANQKLAFELEDGLEIICAGRMGVYEKSGAYQLYAEEIELRGKGALQLAFEQLKKKLAEEGLFDPAAKKPIPVYPSCIGVVTSQTGAALRDILNVLTRRVSDVHVIVRPVRVQGAGSAEEIAGAIDDLNRFGKVDVIIVGRGGGSIEDLWAFNEEVVARAIYASRIPVISAVGHEIDWTISDFAADLRAPTPSAAAELVSLGKEELVNRLRYGTEKLDSYISYMLEQLFQRIDEALARGGYSLMHTVELAGERLASLGGRLEALSPLGVLARGYTVTYNARGEAVKSAGDVAINEEILTHAAKGAFYSRVTRKDKKSNL